MGKPIRVQRQRKKGFKTPANTIYVGRPSKWGNPFDIPKTNPNAPKYIRYRLHLEAVESYIHHLKINPEIKLRAKRELSGKNLSCFCPHDMPCHADILLKIANED